MNAAPYEAATGAQHSPLSATVVVRDCDAPASAPPGPRHAWWQHVLTLPEFRHWSTCDDVECQVCDALWQPVARYLFDRAGRAA